MYLFSFRFVCLHNGKVGWLAHFPCPGLAYNLWVWRLKGIPQGWSGMSNLCPERRNWSIRLVYHLFPHISTCQGAIWCFYFIVITPSLCHGAGYRTQSFVNPN